MRSIILLLTNFFLIYAPIYAEKIEINSFDLKHPDNISILPDSLREISGITGFESGILACVQDEKGIIFIYNTDKNKIIRKYHFHIDGDYEGIAKVENTIFVLRSDGNLFEISDYHLKNLKMAAYNTMAPSGDYEGLCYDADQNRLLIACKGKIGKETGDKDKRGVFAFDLKTKLLAPEPVIEFNLHDIKRFIKEHQIKKPGQSKNNGKSKDQIISFVISDIAIEPVSKKLFLLSSSEPMILILNRKGKISRIEYLDPVLFSQPEGIAFLDNGDMLISSEGGDKKPALLRFNYRNK